ncbi:hypothetical protein MUK42_36394 [Musa troglodytarum]|nr:hypothetical protein MUK42_36394 [Musa troglodytarum]URD95394.1 hypothetical protein MUK42_36394 [Musa troglodytarum]URD95397.1 hypothetical protein MUK42_36394 [Musa troglodytarum]
MFMFKGLSYRLQNDMLGHWLPPGDLFRHAPSFIMCPSGWLQGALPHISMVAWKLNCRSFRSTSVSSDASYRHQANLDQGGRKWNSNQVEESVLNSDSEEASSQDE